MNLRFAWICVPSLTVFAAAAPQGATSTASISSSGVLANDNSYLPSISADGRWIAYMTRATNLVAGDTNGAADVFLHDRQSGTTTRASVDSNGAQADDQSLYPGLSGDGRFVSFPSLATNLVPGDANGVYDVFVHDQVTGATERVSVSTSGVEGNGHSGYAYPSRFSYDGRFVAFQSAASNLVLGDTNGKWDIFVRDRATARTTRVSVDSAGVEGAGDSYSPAVSADGRFVAFMTDAELVTSDDNGFTDCYVHDRLAGTTTRVSVDSFGSQGNGYSLSPVISDDGRWVAFDSSSSNLVWNDTNNQYDVFLHDRVLGQTERISVSDTGEQGQGFMSRSPSISSDGRFVAFDSMAFNLVPGDTNGMQDVFVHDHSTRSLVRISVNAAGVQTNGQCNRPSISGDGRAIAFGSSATNLVPGDTNAIYDAYVRQVDCWPSASYCQAGISSSYCTPAMSSTGTASAGASSGFTLICDGLDGQRSGLLFYGTSGRQAQPWGPPGGSLQCVAPPVQRTAVQFSGGTALFCDGSISLDWLAYLATHPGALGLPLTPGTVVDAQCWYRDPGAPLNSNLSNALEFEVCP